MLYVLIILSCTATGFLSEECKPMEIAVFESRAECEKAKGHYEYHQPVCGIKQDNPKQEK
jgi:hypothetical protein